MGGLIVAPLDGERRGVDADLDRRRPVGVHLTVFVMIALELQLQVRSGERRAMTKIGIGSVAHRGNRQHSVVTNHSNNL